MEDKEILERVGRYLERKGINYDVYPIQSKDQNNSDTAIVLDWNLVNNNLYDVLEDNFDLYYGDDCITCTECGKLINTIPSCYGWQPNYIKTEFELVCLDCIYDSETLESALDYYLNNPESALFSYCEEWVRNLNFSRINEDNYLSGLHEGMNAKPDAILKEMQKQYPDSEFLFIVSETSQFYLGFSIFRRIKE